MSSSGSGDIRLWIIGIGLALMLFSIILISSWTQNIFYLVTGWFLLMLGAAAFITPLATYAWWDRPPVPRVRCRQCFTLNYETDMRCRKCGNNLF